MEWYNSLLFTLCGLGGLICVAVVGLHIFEWQHVHKQKANASSIGISDISFDIGGTNSIGSMTSSNSSERYQDHQGRRKPSTASQLAFIPHRSPPDTPTSSSTRLTFSPVSTASPQQSLSHHQQQEQSWLPSSPTPARTNQSSRLHYLSFDAIRRNSDDSLIDERMDRLGLEVGQRDKQVADGMIGMGW